MFEKCYDTSLFLIMAPVTRSFSHAFAATSPPPHSLISHYFQALLSDNSFSSTPSTPTELGSQSASSTPEPATCSDVPMLQSFQSIHSDSQSALPPSHSPHSLNINERVQSHISPSLNHLSSDNSGPPILSNSSLHSLSDPVSQTLLSTPPLPEHISGTEVESATRTHIRALRHVGRWSYRRIAGHTKLSLTTVYRIAHPPRTPHRQCSHRGQHHILSSPIRKKIIYLATSSAANRRKPLTEIAFLAGIKASAQTLQRSLALASYHRRVARKKPWLSPKNREVSSFSFFFLPPLLVYFFPIFTSFHSSC